MRLQVTIARHTLPLVNIIFNTTSAPEPVATISDFLNALNAIVPLESSDGEWGLEEYTVEVAASTLQDKYYECLHFQLVEDVFKENDEVVVRGLTTDELRQRRQGGRLQISSDGRKLHDGVAWGRRFRPMSYRPDVVIPPRKRRRLMVETPDLLDEENGNQLQLEYPFFEPQMGTIVNDDLTDDDEDDDDYVEGQEEEDDGDDSVSGDSGPEISAIMRELHDDSEGQDYTWRNGRRTISTTAIFDNADVDEDETDPNNTDTYGAKFPVLPSTELENTDLGRYISSQSIKSANRKAKVKTSRHVRFDEPPHPSHDPGSPRTAIRFGSHSVRHPSELENDDSASDDDDDFEINAERGDESQSSDEVESTSASSSDDSEGDSEDSSDDSTSSSGSDSSSEDASSEDETVPHHQISKVVPSISGKLSTDSTPKQPAADNPPGSGTSRTKKNNDRVKRRKRLDFLKANGTLPADADFQALNAYETSQRGAKKSTRDALGHEKLSENATDALERKRREILALISHDSEDLDVATESSWSSALPNPTASDPTRPNGVSEVANNNGPESGSAKSEPSAKRSRLDVASSRRLLFGSLGLKTPKTKDAEDQLRQKLDNAARQTERKSIRSEPDNASTTVRYDDSWKNKLIISAVECVQEGRILTPPPFPFKQNWERDQSVHGQSHDLNRNLSPNDGMDYDEEISIHQTEEHHDSEILSNPPKKVSPSSAVLTDTLTMQDMPYPAKDDDLEALLPAHIVPGNVITYKELYMNARFEPEESDYRVARILNVNVNVNQFQVLLSLRDRRDALNAIRLDDEGGRVYHGFELPEDDPETDDGIRNLSLENLIGAKLVKAYDLQVPASNPSSQSVPAVSGTEATFVPESAQFADLGTSNPESIRASDDIAGASNEDELLQPIQLATSNKLPSARTGAKQDSSSNERIDTVTSSHSNPFVSSSVQSDLNPTTDSGSLGQEAQQSLQPSISSRPDSSPGQNGDTTRKAPNAVGNIDIGKFTSFHDENEETHDSLSSLRSLPTNHVTHVGPADVGTISPSRRTTISGSPRGQSPNHQPSSEAFMDAQSQQASDISPVSNQPSQTRDSPMDASSIIPSTPESPSREDEGSQSSPQPRSSRRIAQAKLDISSPAAKMMRSALAGLGSRKSLNARRKPKV